MPTITHRCGKRPRLHHGLPTGGAILLALLLPVFLAAPARGDNVTITVPNVTVTEAPSVYVSGEILSNGSIEVNWVCQHGLATCPNTTVTVQPAGVAVVFSQEGAECSGPVCHDSAVINGNYSDATLTVTYGSTRYTLTLTRPRGVQGPGSVLQALIPFAVAAGLAARGDLRLSGLGAVAAGVLVYLGGLLGLWPADPRLVYFTIVAGALMLWLAR